MKKWRYIIFLLLSVSISVFSQDGNNQSGTAGASIGADEIIGLSGLQPMVESTAGLTSAGMKKYSWKLTETAAAKYADSVDKAYGKDKMFSVFRKAFTEKLKREDIPETEKWLSSPLGRKITDIEKRSLTPEGAKEFENYIPKALALEEKRKALVREFLEETSAEEMSVKIICEPLATMMNSLRDTLPEDLKTPQDKFDADLDVIKSEALLRYRSILPVSVAFTYRELSDEEFSKMLDFYGTGTGKNFNSAVLEALVSSMNSAGAECGKGMAGLLIDAKKRHGEKEAGNKIGDPENRRNGL